MDLGPIPERGMNPAISRPTTMRRARGMHPVLRNWGTTVWATVYVLLLCSVPSGRGGVLVEAEGFAEKGGWVVDQQFMDIMGSPYLLAHGRGKPVADAVTTVEFAAPGRYRLWVRTRDWVPEPEWAPGQFCVEIDGHELPATFGVEGNGWIWQDGGTVEVAAGPVRIRLRDLTGFEGRCDALFFADAGQVPPSEPGREMATWRRTLLGLPAVPASAGEFDVVVVGGGFAGCAAAITAARLGCAVAFVQDRPVLGGNNSPDIRVHSAGAAHGPVVTREINGEYGHRTQSPQWWSEPSGATRAEEHRRAVVEAEPNISLYLGWHAFSVATEQGRVLSVDARNICTSAELRFAAPVFIDCTGDGSIGYWAGADCRMGREAREEHNESLAPTKADSMTLGSSVLWGAGVAEHAVGLQDVPWALAVSGGNPAFCGNWRWEYGHLRNTLTEAEEIRDHLFRAAYGSFATAKGRDLEKYANYELRWMNYIAGKRETRRLLGDYVLTQNDIQEQTKFDDVVAIGSFYIDIHEPTTLHGGSYEWQIVIPPEVWAVTDKKRERPYDIPFRCLYSRNIRNLMMAGRCLSATHVAHASARLMKTGAQTGVAAGAAAYLCKQYDLTPKQAGAEHIRELQDIVFARGDYADRLKPKFAAPPAEPNPLTGMRVGVARVGTTRTADQYEIVSLPEFCDGRPCVVVDRHSNKAPSPAYSFAVDKPVTVYLLVDRRGDLKMPDAWEKLEATARWRAGNQEFADTVYRKAFPAGKVEIPGHEGTDGTYFGLPNTAVVDGPTDVKITTSPER